MSKRSVFVASAIASCFALISRSSSPFLETASNRRSNSFSKRALAAQRDRDPAHALAADIARAAHYVRAAAQLAPAQLAQLLAIGLYQERARAYALAQPLAVAVQHEARAARVALNGAAVEARVHAGRQAAGQRDEFAVARRPVY